MAAALPLQTGERTASQGNKRALQVYFTLIILTIVVIIYLYGNIFNPRGWTGCVPGLSLVQFPCLEAYKLVRSTSEKGLMTPHSFGTHMGEQNDGAKFSGQQIDLYDCWPTWTALLDTILGMNQGSKSCKQQNPFFLRLLE